ncbi:hypothetical protein [Streptomyces niveus]|uniref:hypothetical protein n=1 Tax=Streptomyces niveus TaxID=193462 RepID=UPI00343591E5
MVHLQHTVLVEPVPRRCRHAVRPGGGDLAEGGHLRAGAVYEVDDADLIRVRVLEWDRRAAVRVAQTITDGSVTAEIDGGTAARRTPPDRGAARLDAFDRDPVGVADGGGPARLPRRRERALDAPADPRDTP